MANTTNENIVGGTLKAVGYNFTNTELLTDGYLISVGKEILQSSSLINKFTENLVNRIGKTYIKSNYYTNELADYKKDLVPNGVAIQDIFINSFEPDDFDTMDGSHLLDNDGQQDIISVYYTVNQQKKYRVVTERPELQKAFVSWGEMDNFIEKIINQLYTSQQIYEWNCTKTLLGSDYVSTNPCAKSQMINYYQETFAQDFVKQCRALYTSFTMPSPFNNNFVEYAKGKGLTNIAKNPVTTLSLKDQISLIVRYDTLADVEVDVLAVSFNMDKASLLGKIHAVDNFGVTTQATDGDKSFEYLYSITDPQSGAETKYYDMTNYTVEEDGNTYRYTLVATMCDDSFIHISDLLEPMTSTFFNPDNLSLKTYLHTMTRFGLCPFANARYLYTKQLVPNE